MIYKLQARDSTKGMEKSREEGNKQINILLRMNNG